MCNNCKCKELLTRKNTTATILRRQTIKVLTNAHKNLTPVEIFKKIKETHLINKVTLYRILALLEKKEIVRKILTSTDSSRYELIDPLAKGTQHLPPRFSCRICKTIEPLNSPTLSFLVNKKLNRKFHGPLEIVIEGVCPNCLKEKR